MRRRRLSDAFKALSAEALKSNNESFLNLARTTLEKFQEGARTDLEKRQLAIDSLMKPVQETLGSSTSEDGRAGKIAAGSLRRPARSRCAGLPPRRKRSSAKRRTSSRRSARRGVRGRWGEIQLRRVVEIAGMLQYCDFDQQVHQAGEGGALRPDMVVRLPGGKSVVVDAKTPLAAYLEAIAAPDEATRKARMAEHARSIRDHMISLGKKAYWEQFQPAPEFVVLFLPGENFYSAALEQDATLLEDQMARNRVILATPTTLIALLHAFAYGWKQEALAENAQAISELGRELHERLVVMSDHFGKVGASLGSAVESYNRTLASLDTRVLVSARKFEVLKATHSGKELKSPVPIEVIPRAVPAKEAPLLPKLDDKTGPSFG